MDTINTAGLLEVRTGGSGTHTVTGNTAAVILLNGMNERQKSKAGLLLGELLSGRLTDGERERVRQWLASPREDREKDEALQEVFDDYSSRYSGPSLRTAKAWQKRCRELGITDRSANRLLLRKRMMRVAAVVIPLLIVGAGFLISDRLIEDVAGPSPVYTTITATEGVREAVTLPCGTEIVLKPGAEIAYDLQHYTENRRVSLTGEAFFTVTKVEGKTFTVDAGEVTVTVLGTEFNVRSVEGEGNTEVSLFNGVVEVAGANGTTVLEPMQQLVYDNATGQAETRGFDSGEVAVWRTELHLDNVRLDEAFRMIGAYFGATVVTGDGVRGGKVVRARFRNESLAGVLEMLRSADNDFEYEIEGTTVYITGR